MKRSDNAVLWRCLCVNILLVVISGNYRATLRCMVFDIHRRCRLSPHDRGDEPGAWRRRMDEGNVE